MTWPQSDSGPLTAAGVSGAAAAPSPGLCAQLTEKERADRPLSSHHSLL